MGYGDRRVWQVQFEVTRSPSFGARRSLAGAAKRSFTLWLFTLLLRCLELRVGFASK